MLAEFSRKHTRSSFVYMTALVVLWSLTAAHAYQGQRESESVEREIDGFFTKLTDVRSPGIAVEVRKDGKTLFNRGYGVRDLRTYSAINSKTNFRLASCTKQFTAMAIMLLVHDGRLRYDETLTDVFPEFPAYGKSIAV